MDGDIRSAPRRGPDTLTKTHTSLGRPNGAARHDVERAEAEQPDCADVMPPHDAGALSELEELRLLLRQEVASSVQTRAELRAKTASMDASNQLVLATTQDLHEARARIRELEAANTMLVTSAAEREAMARQTLVVLAKAVGGVENGDLVKLAETAANRLAGADEAREQQARSLDDLAEALARSCERVSMLERRRAEGGVHVGGLEQQAIEYRAKIAELEERITALTQEVAARQADCDAGGSHVRGLELQLADASARLQEFELGPSGEARAREALELEILRLRANLVDAPAREQEIAHYEQLLEAARSEVGAFAELVMDLETRLEKVEADRAEIAERLIVSEGEAAEAREQAQVHARALLAANERLATLQRQLDAGGAHVRGLEAALADTARRVGGRR